MYKRIIFDIVLFLSLFITPWWASFAIAFAGIFFFNDFYEIIALGFIMDIVYGTPNVSVMGVRFINSFAAIALLAGGTFIKNRIRFYPT